MSELVPGDSKIGDSGREDRALHLAEATLRRRHEATAARLAHLLAHHRPGEEPASVRAVGERLGVEGGRWLMVLVAHRAQYLSDPHWRYKQDKAVQRIRELLGSTTNLGGTIGDGPIVRRLEYAWDGICGWRS